MLSSVKYPNNLTNSIINKLTNLQTVMKKNTAVVLFNLGGPDSLESVRPFLYNLFSDPDIFRIPLAFITQRLFAFLVSRRRTAEAQSNYAAIGGKSPILENTRKQADALQRALGDGDYTVFICMRYWHPMTRGVVTTLKREGYEQVILLPLYPQYSTTTTGSSVNEFRRHCQQQHYQPSIKTIDPWYEQDGYQLAIVESIKNAAEKLPDSHPESIHLLFSAHGLPQKIVDGGDPYEKQIQATYEAMRHRLQWPHTSLCYQSRVGPLQWLQPYIQDVLQELAQKGTRQVLVYPIAFVSDHVETLYELGMQYAELARSLGIPHYRVVPALNDHPLLIKTLAQLVLDKSS